MSSLRIYSFNFHVTRPAVARMAIVSHVTSLAPIFLVTGNLHLLTTFPLLLALVTANLISSYELEPFQILHNCIYFFSREFPVSFLLKYSFFLFDLLSFFVY